MESADAARVLVVDVPGKVGREETLLVQEPPEFQEGGIMIASGTNPQSEPSASGVPTRYNDALAYIGWRTMAYGPVEITF